MKDHFEEADITVKDNGFSAKKFFRTKPYSGLATVKFLKGDDEKVIFEEEVTITKGKLDKVLTHKMPLVENTEESYTFKVVLEYKSVRKEMLNGTIWPKKTKVFFQDQDNKPIKSFSFVVKQRNQADQKLSTDSKGKSTLTLMDRGPYTISPRGKYRVLKDEQVTPGQFRDHKITVKAAITARFESPDTTKDPYKDDAAVATAKIQWVNLTSKEASHAVGSGCDAKGNRVVVSVTADPPEDGMEGDRVYFEINFGLESKRDDPAPRLTSSSISTIHSKKVSTDKKKITGYLTLDNSTPATGSFEIDLGIAGGDTCEVKIGGTSSCADAKFKLVNWRKIYAQVTRTAALTAPSLATAQSCFKKVNIDLEEATADAVIVAPADVPAGSIVDGAMMERGTPAQSLVVGDHNVASFKTKLNPRFKSEKLPVAHLIYCDFQVDAEGLTYTQTKVVKGKKTGQVQSTVSFPETAASAPPASAAATGATGAASGATGPTTPPGSTTATPASGASATTAPATSASGPVPASTAPMTAPASGSPASGATAPASGATTSASGPTTPATGTTGTASGATAPASGATAPAAPAVPAGLKILGTDAGKSALFFAKDVTDGTDSVKICRWEEAGPAAPGTTLQSGDIGPTDYKIDHVKNGNALYIRLPAAAQALSDAGKDINVTFKVAYADGWYNGWCTSTDRHNVIRVNRPDKDCCGTIVHEIGHAIAQAAKPGATDFPGLPSPHPWFYTNSRGHMGPHCAFGLPKDKYDDPTVRLDSTVASNSCTCVMYGAGSTLRNTNLVFCADCEKYVKAAKINAVTV